MQQMSARAEYALLAVLDLARHSSEDDPSSVGQVAERTGAPRKYLVEILQQLKKNFIVASRRGRYGGYYLKRPAHHISAAQVLDAVEPEPVQEPDAEASPDDDVVRWAWRRAEKARMQVLSDVSIAALLQRSQAGDEAV